MNDMTADPLPVAFDPYQPLPSAPDPWAGSQLPAVRLAPPYLMTEMIAAEPALAERVLARLAEPQSGAAILADALRTATRAHEPIVVTGCGTSEHGAIGAVEILRDAIRQAGLPGRPVAAQAFEAALDPQEGGVIIGVSHEGGTWATMRALEAAKTRGARVAVLTVSDRSPSAALADIVVATEEMDQSWCHTVGYLSPLLAAAATGAWLAGVPIDRPAVRDLISEGTRAHDAAEQLAATIAGSRIALVVASGADRPAARELVLKIEEGAWVPSAMRDLETFLHGHLAATDAETALILILTDRDHRPERLARARQVLAAAQVVGVNSGAILAAALDGELEPSLIPSGRLLVPDAPALPAPVAALLGTATPLQLLAEQVARARGTNPDAIRRDDPRYLEAAAAAG